MNGRVGGLNGKPERGFPERSSAKPSGARKACLVPRRENGGLTRDDHPRWMVNSNARGLFTKNDNTQVNICQGVTEAFYAALRGFESFCTASVVSSKRKASRHKPHP